MRLIILIFALPCLFFTSCASTQDVQNSTNTEDNSTEKPTNSEIVKLDFEIVKSKKNQEQITLIKSEVIAGKLDESEIIYPPKELSKLLVRLVDSKNIITDELVIMKSNLQIIDQYEEEEQKELINDQIERNYFSIRFNKSLNVKTVKIFKLEDEKSVEIYNEKIARF
ncbi:hypothetical protein [Brumimicrobium mesophilum]|uniref:hypothetical protein n=1 Tax=Brumimicrobium mesophilum TaxID=392717 RepID=UPI000D14211A|nr:hypothetical protein [Brumimicrobium mesophilum]